VKTVDWSVNGLWQLNGYYLQQAAPLNVPIFGSGTSLVTLASSFSDRAYGYFQVSASGAATVSLAPSGFIDQHRLFDGSDTGYYDTTGADTTIMATGANRFLHLTGACYLSENTPIRSGEDFCGNAAYRLTYDYTPLALGGVPEPATWAMMILGMGAVGFSMRSAKRRSEKNFDAKIKAITASALA
jgi:hypothetical protein